MRIAVLVFPGSNCERETILALKRAGMTPVEVLWNEQVSNLAEFHGYVLVGGFSYEDRGRAGVIAAHLPIMAMIKQQSLLGKPILGICNGAQILVECGLVPGMSGPRVALTDNKRILKSTVLGTGYYNAWIQLKPSLKQPGNAFTRLLKPDSVLHVPIAHAEGRFLIPDPLLSQIKASGLSTFQYCDEQGNISDEFPINPNGSVDNIAALSNPAGNVMAIMPHPERTPNGDILFQSMRHYLESGYKPHAAHADSHKQEISTRSYQSNNTRELIVELIIADNHALTIGKTFATLGLPVRVTRQIYWEIGCDSDVVFQQVKASGVLFNDKKERVVEKNIESFSSNIAGSRGQAAGGRECGDAGYDSLKQSFLILAKDDLIGLQKMQILAHHFAVDGIQSLQRGVLWHIEAEPGSSASLIDQVIDSGILFNSTSHECYRYDPL